MPSDSHTYSITYELYNGQIRGQPIELHLRQHGHTCRTQQDGYTFGGWYNDAGFGTKVTGIYATETGDKTFYAKWTASTYSITYALNGGTNNAANPATYTFGSAVTLADPSRTGYTFGGWFGDEGFNTEATGISATDIGPKMFYAKWTINQYTISFNTNGGSEVPAVTQDYNTKIPAPDTARNGYTLEGWYKEASFTNRVDFAYTITGDATLFAKWTANTYDITYNANGGAGSMTNTPANTDASVTPANNAFTRLGYNFTGWNTREDGSGTPYTSSEAFCMPAGGLVLYAQWAPVPLDDVIEGMTIIREEDGTIIAQFPTVSADITALGTKSTPHHNRHAA
jgi:uncharacterized repeat protein (TIGR02543 family)